MPLADINSSWLNKRRTRGAIPGIPNRTFTDRDSTEATILLPLLFLPLPSNNNQVAFLTTAYEGGYNLLFNGGYDE
jgi:hypothetical protein